MKKWITRIVITLVAIALVIISLAPIDTVNGGEGRNWMKNLDDSAKINSISIPGTHDSGAIYSIADVAGKCQSLTIESQLNAGVRFLDIRLKQNGNKLALVHSFVDQKTDFETQLKIMVNFLKSNPSEFLIVSIKEDDDAVDATVSFDMAVKTELDKYASYVNFNTTLPTTIGEARGKIHIVSRFYSSFGVSAYSGWRDSTSFEIGSLFVQDHYELDGYQRKKDEIQNALAKAKSQTYSLVINFASGYQSDGFPPSYATTTARQINPWLAQTLKETDGCVGVILFDFITTDLAKTVYGRNF